MRPINSAGIMLIKKFESFSTDSYQDEGGVWTIGYGHTQGVSADTPSLTEEAAELLLRQDIHQVEECIESAISVPLSDNQYAALVSLVYNAGPTPLKRTLGIKLNSQDYAGAAQEFLRWRLVGGMVSDGLVRRREAERSLFLTADTKD